MKHRSVIAFILVVAALFAAPQISNDLSALKSEVGARIRGELFHAFLNLRAGDGANELVARRADPLLASYEAKGKTCTQSQATTNKSDGRAQVSPRAEAATKKDAGKQLAMLIDPASGTVIARAALSNIETRIALDEAVALSRSVLAQGDLAMLNPPDSGVELPAFADAAPRRSDATRRLLKSAETQVRVSVVAADFEKFGATKMGEEMLHHVGTALTDGRATEKETRMKVLKFRRANQGGGGNGTTRPLKMNAPLPLPVAALVPPDLALPPASACATASE